MATSTPGSPGRRSWRDAAAASAQGKDQSHKGRKIFQLLAVFLALTGVFVALVWLLWNPAHTPYYLPLYVTEHTSPYVPVNAQARQDREAILHGGYFPQGSKNLYTSQERRLIDQELDDLKRRPAGEALLTYLSGAVICDAKGELFLIPGDADIDSPSAWLRLRDILSALHACPSSQKLLVLDIMQPLADPRMGVLANDTSKRVQQLVEENKEINYWVLCACSPGQTALVSEELHRSVFNYYFEQALRGWADGAVDGRKDGRVTVKEMTQFVQKRVDAWADRNRKARQTPIVLVSGKDFELVRLPKGGPRRDDAPQEQPPAAESKGDASSSEKSKGETATAEKSKGDSASADKAKTEASSAAADKSKAEKAKADEAKGEARAQAESKGDASLSGKSKNETEAYPQWLADGWKQRERWWQDRTFALAPQVFRQLEAGLMRAEQQWRGGTPPEKIKDRLVQALKEWESAGMKCRSSLPRPDEPRSLALAVALGKPVSPDTLAAARDLVTKLNKLERERKPAFGKDGTEKPKEGEKNPQADLEKELLGRFSEKPGVLKDPSGFDLSLTVFHAAVEDPNLDRAHLQFLHGLLEKYDLETRYLETLFLHRLWKLVAPADTDGSTWPADAARRALRVVLAGERAAALACAGDETWEPRAFPWIHALLENAAQKRHDAEVMLFARGYASPSGAEVLLRNAEADYRRIDDYLEALHAAHHAYDEALALLPGFAGYLAEHETLDRESWQNSVDLVQDLHGILAHPPGDAGSAADLEQLPSRINDLKQKADLLRELLSRLARPFTRELPALIGRVKHFNAGPEHYLEAQAALQLPWLPAAGRVELWAAMHNLGLRLQEKTPSVDQGLTELPPFESGKAERREQDRTARRAQILLDLFRLGGVADTDPWQKKLAEARQRAEAPAAWPALGQELRQAWADLPKHAADDANAMNRAWVQDRLSRIYYPLDAARQQAEADNNPSLEIERVPALAYWRWLGDRYQYAGRDLRAIDAERETIDFYTSTADRYLEYARASERLPHTVATFAAAPGAVRPNLREGQRSADYEVRLTLEGQGGAAARPLPKLRLLKADEDWLDVDPTLPGVQGSEPAPVRLHIQLKPEADTTSTPPPQGFLLQARVDGRSFHYRVGVDTPPLSSERLRLLLSDRPEPRQSSLSELRLRPNVQQEIYVFVRNPVEIKRSIFVELLADNTPPLKSPVIELGGGTHKIAFEVAKPAPMPGVPLPPLQKPIIQIRLVEKRLDKEITLDRKQLPVVIRQPSEYVRVQLPQYTAGETNRLTVVVNATQPILGEPCPVELVLAPENIPGLRNVEAIKGNRKDKLGGQGKEKVELTAENLEFDERANNNGEVAVTIDGYERAYVYHVTFANQGAAGLAREVNRPFLRLPSKLMTRPNVPYLLPLQVFSTEQDVRVEVGVDRLNRGDFKLLPLFQGAREQRIGFAPSGPPGALLFETAVKDWGIPIDTVGFNGPCSIRVRLLDATGKHLAMVAPALATLIVDGTPPDDLHFKAVNNTVPSGGAGETTSLRVPRAETLEVTVEGQDKESQIKEVLFFQGEPVKNGRPDNVKPERAAATNNEKTRWQARLPLAVETRGRVPITAEFVNGVGLSSFKTIWLDLYDPAAAAAAAAKANGSVEGTVFEGSDRPVEGVTVKLLDEKGNLVKSSEKTNATGKFTIPDVAPGSYQASATNPNSERFDVQKVAVSAGKAASVTLNLHVK